jgi:hypothetical protein
LRKSILVRQLSPFINRTSPSGAISATLPGRSSSTLGFLTPPGHLHHRRARAPVGSQGRGLDEGLLVSSGGRKVGSLPAVRRGLAVHCLPYAFRSPAPTISPHPPTLTHRLVSPRVCLSALSEQLLTNRYATTGTHSSYLSSPLLVRFLRLRHRCNTSLLLRALRAARSGVVHEHCGRSCDPTLRHIYPLTFFRWAGGKRTVAICEKSHLHLNGSRYMSGRLPAVFVLPALAPAAVLASVS